MQREVQNAFDRNVPVIPLRLENVAPEGNLEFYMGSVHWLDALTPPLEQHLARLTQTVTGMLRSAPARRDGVARTEKAIGAADSSAQRNPQEDTRPVTPHRSAEAPDVSVDRLAEPPLRSLDQSVASDVPPLFISYAVKDSAIADEVCAARPGRGPVAGAGHP